MGFSSFEATYYFEPRGNTLLVEDMVARELCYRLLEFKFIFAHRTLSFGGCKGHKLLFKNNKKKKKEKKGKKETGHPPTSSSEMCLTAKELMNSSEIGGTEAFLMVSKQASKRKLEHR